MVAAQDTPLVTLSIEFVSGGGVDRSASLVWLNDAGEEHHYTDIMEHATITQETFPGHRWMVKGKRSHEILLSIRAEAQPALQKHRIDAGDVVQRHVSAHASNHAEGQESTQTSSDQEEDEEGGVGVWMGADGLHRFERIRRGAANSSIEWKQIDASSGDEIGRFLQVEARVTTRWLWWLSAFFRKMSAMPDDRSYLLSCMLSVAGAWQLDAAAAQWVGRLTGVQHRNPITLLIILLFAAGAAAAAAVPLQECDLVLYSMNNRNEVKLGERQGLAREPSDDPVRPARWLHVCDGSFERMPQELRRMRGRKAHHHMVLASLVALIARLLFMKLLR